MYDSFIPQSIFKLFAEVNPANWDELMQFSEKEYLKFEGAKQKFLQTEDEETRNERHQFESVYFFKGHDLDSEFRKMKVFQNAWVGAEFLKEISQPYPSSTVLVPPAPFTLAHSVGIVMIFTMMHIQADQARAPEVKKVIAPLANCLALIKEKATQANSHSLMTFITARFPIPSSLRKQYGRIFAGAFDEALVADLKGKPHSEPN